MGAQNMKLAVISRLGIAIVILLYSCAGKRRDTFVLIIRGGENVISQEDVEKIIDRYTVKRELKTVNRTDFSTEMIYEVKAGKTLDMELTEALKAVGAVESVNWLVKSGEMVG